MPPAPTHLAVGLPVGIAEGLVLGLSVGLAVGFAVGLSVGLGGDRRFVEFLLIIFYVFFCCAYRLASHSPCRGTTSGTVCGLDSGGQFKVPRVFALVSSFFWSAIDTTSSAPGIKWFGPVNVLHPASVDTTVTAVPHTLLVVVLIVTPTVCKSSECV